MKLLPRVLICILPLLTAISATAQNNGKQTLQGIVTDLTSEKPLEFATVLLRDTVSGKVVQGGTTNEKGNFSIQTSKGNFTLEVSFVGYSSAKYNISVNANGIEGAPKSIALQPQANQLDEITVTAKKPVIERKIDMLVMNVESMISAESSTGLELLKRAPGVSIDTEGNITLNGKDVQVWIDGRPSNLSGQELVALLEGTEGANIEKIEIISNPSSKYDAAGSGGIINLKTKKNFAVGLNGNVRAGYTQFIYDDFFYNANGSIALNYRGEKLSTFFNYSARNGKGFGLNNEAMYTHDTLRRKSDMNLNDESVNHSGKLGFDYFINKKNTLGAVANFSYRSSHDEGSSHAILFNTPLPADSSLSKGDNTSNNINGTLNLNYTHQFDKEQQELNLNADYMRYNSDGKQDQHTQFYSNSNPTQLLDNSNNQLISIYSLRADYTHPINDKMKLEGGGKIAQSATDNHSTEKLSVQDIPIRDVVNDFVYNERVSALYANYAWGIDTVWSAKAGLRYENTHSMGDWKTADTTTSKSYNDFFPTLYIGFNPSQNHNFGLSYTRRIRRPNYWQLNPFKRVVSPYLIIVGNPNLTPAYTDIIKVDYTLFKFINLSADYSYTRDMIIQVPETLPGNITSYTQGNFGVNKIISFNLYLSQVPVTKWWTIDFNTWSAYIINQNYDYTSRSFGANIWINNTFTLSKTIKMELQGWGSSPMTWGYFNIKAQGAVDLSIKKTFWDNAASLSINANDIFNTNRFASQSEINGTFRQTDGTWESRSVSVSLSYKFGKASQPARQRKTSELEEGSRMGGGDSN